MDSEATPAPPEKILRTAEDQGVNGEVCITVGASRHIRTEINRLRKIEEAAQEAVENPGDYAPMFRLRRALHEGDEDG